MAYDFDKIIDRRGSDSVKWGRFDDDVLPLWVADVDFLSPQPVINALRERVEHGVFGYGTEPSELREVVVERLQRLYGWRVSPEALEFLPGVVPGFNLACQAVTTAGDGVLVQTPVYPPFFEAPPNAGCTPDEMELTLGADSRYTIDFDAFEDAITNRTRMFILCNPHNPVGRVFERWELVQMAEICLRHDMVICSDEIHDDLLFSGHHHIPVASLSPEIEAHTVTLMAPSKTFNVAGFHCSVAIVPDKALRERFLAARRGLMPELDIMGYVVGLAAYGYGDPWLEQMLRYLEANRDYTVQYVCEHLPGIRTGIPEGTYLAWLDCREAGIPGNPHEFFLEKAKVAVNDGATFGRGGEGFVRLNFGCARAALEEALERMREALASLAGAPG
ncbi:MAG TPA: PatB family C-S lyase [Anaerolineae bacterium]|nr:PatB family C-S lyase [Anaerolineae bacterium]